MKLAYRGVVAMFFGKPNKIESNSEPFDYNQGENRAVATVKSLAGYYYPVYSSSRFAHQALVGVTAGTLGFGVKYGALLCLETMKTYKNDYKISPPDIKLSHPLRLCVTGPILEEAMFRGFLMPVMRYHLTGLGMNKDHAENLSVLGSSLFFSAAHVRGNRIAPFIGGLIYGKLTQHYHDNLIPCTVAHMTNNTIVMTGVSLLRKR